MCVNGQNSIIGPKYVIQKNCSPSFIVAYIFQYGFLDNAFSETEMIEILYLRPHSYTTVILNFSFSPSEVSENDIRALFSRRKINECITRFSFQIIHKKE